MHNFQGLSHILRPQNLAPAAETLGNDPLLGIWPKICGWNRRQAIFNQSLQPKFVCPYFFLLVEVFQQQLVNLIVLVLECRKPVKKRQSPCKYGVDSHYFHRYSPFFVASENTLSFG
jgi:hypothetical protein